MIAHCVMEMLNDGNNPTLKELFFLKFSYLYEAIRQKSVLLPCLFIFMWQATPSWETAGFYFYTNELHFSPEFLGKINIGGAIASIIGVGLFQKYLKNIEISKVILGATILSALVGLSNLILITHTNRIWGLNDELFAFADNVLLTVIGQVAFMPILVLAARLCPPGIEGTLFAALMSGFNAASALGSELGALLTAWLEISDTDFTNLPALVVICSILSLLPLPFIGLLDSSGENYEKNPKKE